jgi:hypothetical protein
VSSDEKRTALQEARTSLEELSYDEIRERVGSDNADWRFTMPARSGKEYDVQVQTRWWDEERECIVVIVQIGWATVSSFVRCPEGIIERQSPTTPRSVMQRIFRSSHREEPR